MTEKDNEQAQRPVAGMRSLALGAFCAFGVFIISIGIGMSSVMAGKKILLTKSEKTPLPMEYSEATDEVYLEAKRKISGFLKGSKDAGKLQFSLNANELNSLVAHDNRLANLKGVLKFRINNGEILAETSFPLDRIEGLDGKGDGLFLNGETKFQLFVKKDELRVFTEGFYLQGEKLEVDAIASLQQINVLAYLKDYENIKGSLNLVVDVVCEDDKLLIRNWREKKATN
ncbi:MAG: hypothetical protein NE334_01300 [Lentisphaeraceae bacterium]|nr:hypothetical protein [Lentisphaeraceae bacterium]